MKGKLFRYAAVLSAMALLASCGTVDTSEDVSSVPIPGTSIVVPDTSEPSEPEPSSVDTTVHVSSIAFAESEISLNAGESQHVSVSVLPENADDKTFVVSSDHPEIATYDVATGDIRGLTPGTAILTATANDGGLTGSITVHVIDPTVHVESIAFAQSSVSLEKGQSTVVGVSVLPANADDKSYSVVSDHPEIATYDKETGTVTAVAVGTAILTATATDGALTATLEVEVLPISAKSISFSEESVSLEEGESLVVEATVLPADAANKAYSVVSDHPEIAAYDNATHTLSAIAVGNAVLTATTEDGGHTATLAVTVTEISVKSVSWADESITIMATDSVVVEATVLPANAANKAYTVVSDHPEIASYDNETHTLTGVAEGSAVLTATTADGSLTAELPVIVTRNIYADADWESLVGDRDYSFLEDGSIHSHVEDSNFAADRDHYNFSNPHFLLSTSSMPALERGLNYTISGQVHSETVYQNNQVDKEIDAGVVVYYKDANNFLTVGVKWANWDRPHEVRSIYLAGKIGGNRVNASDSWTDNCAVDPYLFHSLEVTKIHNVFTFKAYKTNDARVKVETPFKTGQFSVPSLTRDNEGNSTRLGLYGVNDEFIFENLNVTPYVVPASNDQVTYTNEGHDNLVLDTWFGTYTLGSESGTYSQEGLLITLTPTSGEPHDVDIVVSSHTWSDHVEIIDTDPQFEIDARSSEVMIDAFNDVYDRNYKVEFDIYGTATTAVDAVVGLYTSYRSNDSFSNVYVQWSASERPGQIRCVQIHNWNGSSDSWNDLWCDWMDDGASPSNLYTSNGYHMVIVKTGDSYSIDLTDKAGTFHKTGTVNLGDKPTPYSIKWFARGDKFTIKNAKFDFGGNYTISEGGDAKVIDSLTDVTLSTGTALYNHAYSGAHTIDVDVKGKIVSAVTGDVNADFYPWYVDADNYLKVQVSWRSWDRPSEIREFTISGKFGGAVFGGEWGIETFGDNPNNNALPIDGFHLSMTLSDSACVVTLSTIGGWAKTATATHAIDLTSYKVMYGALGDTFSFTNLTIA